MSPCKAGFRGTSLPQQSLTGRLALSQAAQDTGRSTRRPQPAAARAEGACGPGPALCSPECFGAVAEDWEGVPGRKIVRESLLHLQVPY